jgi:hypothetical protein
MASDASSGGSTYDVFLSYNSADHVVVEDIARKSNADGQAKLAGAAEEKIGEEGLDRTNFSGARSFGCGILGREVLPISGDLIPAVLLHPIQVRNALHDPATSVPRLPLLAG